MIRTAILAALSSCVLALPAMSEQLTDMSPGTKVSNVVTMGKTQIPLPMGEWEIGIIHTWRDGTYGKIGAVLLEQAKSLVSIQ